ncbi:lipoyl(octanoyl) transferase LipB [Parafilimonas terrae]|uniref:Octanoyltransferase n=1 Tax=Parafilimonas terrae TaxID=1465490 RepID=A0A1I5YIB1_9BACT|nr:lipoyl(octanoyl) transferase LipB [Parafilimonas terrae]SFQ43617.1 lipoyl(octanoyl) transferase [Parafilimonas terrae]
MHEIILQDLGRRAYKETWDYQEELLQQKIKAKQENLNQPDYLLFVEHNPVYTLGKNGKEKNLLINEQMLASKGIEYFHINRGGDITFHGPEQLVGYPVLDLDNYKTDLGWYLRSLEEVIILTIGEYGLKGERSKGETGVWLDAAIKGKERKICAMGIRCSRWITMHGFALNVNVDLNYFNFITPCGIQDKQVTSMQKELGYAVDMNEVKEKLVKNFERVFEARILTPAAKLSL